MRKLTKTERRLLDEAFGCSSMSTPRWRDYVPLSNLGLVDLSENEIMSTTFGGVYRRVVITEKGRALVRAAQVSRKDNEGKGQ